MFVIDADFDEDFNGEFLMVVAFLILWWHHGHWRELQNALIGVDFGHVVGIPTPARVETIDKIVDLGAEYVHNR